MTHNIGERDLKIAAILRRSVHSPPDHISLLTIDDEELPYRRSVSLITPSLYLELGDAISYLSLSTGSFGLPTHCADRHTIEVEKIPTIAELSLNYSHGSDELAFQLRLEGDSFASRLCVGMKMQVGEMCTMAWFPGRCSQPVMRQAFYRRGDRAAG